MTKTGPGHPPAHSRFRKGRSGNPNGRPRKVSDAGPPSAFDIIVDKTLTITKDGESREMSVEEALQHRTYQEAIAGSRAARRAVLGMIARREQALAKSAKPAGREVKLVSEADPDNANEALLILGIACEDPRDFGPDDTRERLKLEPWAVQAALSRRRGGKRLTRQEIDEIKRCTLDPKRLRWPRGTSG